MLHLLTEYSRKHDRTPEPGFCQKSVRWVIMCDEKGRFLNVTEIGRPDEKRNPGRSFEKCPDLSQPEMKAGGIIKSHFLVDTTQTVALHRHDINDLKISAKHSYFVDLLRKAGTVVPGLKNLADLLDDPVMLQEIQTQLAERKVRPTDKITFMIGREFPLESDSWHDWWRSFRKTLATEKSLSKSKKRTGVHQMRSFLTGELIRPATTHPKIEKLSDVGGLSTGDVLIGFKQDSFCSYGFEQSINAAVSNEDAAVYCDALNHLLRTHSTRLAKAKTVHWFKEKIAPEDDPLPWLEAGGTTEELSAQRRARELLESLKSGKRADLQNNYYYALTLSGAAGRVMVRDWMEGQFEELVENIGAWFDDLAIVYRNGGMLAPSAKFLAVLGGTVRDLDDLPSPFVAKMWRVAVRGEPIPASALAQALARTRVDVIQDHPPNHARMGLMKAYHLRESRKRGEIPTMETQLNENHPSPAYHCGRLMAVLAGLQRAALGDVGAGVVQRYYAAASCTPALVFGRLTNTSQHHLAKLDSPGLSHWYESKIAGIWIRIKDSVPATLTLEEQSLFALGYYQQMADLRTKKSDTPVVKTEENND